MSARLTGKRATIRALTRLPGSLRDASSEVMNEWADDVEETAKKLVPVRTGTLQANITHFVKDDAHLQFARVGTFAPEVYYSKFVEFGTSDTPEQPFLRPAFNQHKRGVAKAFRRAVRRKLG